MGVLKMHRKNGATLVTLGDHIDIRCAREFYAGLNDALARKTGKIILDAQNLTRIDTATLQLLIACTHEARHLKKTITWQNVKKEFRDCVEVLGASQALGLKQH